MFTHERFRKVQTQFKKNVNCIIRSTESALGFTVYEVVEQVSTQHSISLRFDDLVFRSYNIYKFALEFEEFTVILHRAYDNVIDEMQEYKAKSKEKYLLSHENIFLDDTNDLQSLLRVRTRGCLKNRLGSNTEK
ncbi:hypothetical protein Ahy_B03g065407 [Arachis hypogaea]|uniref:Protein FAR1-RELATED SEQUENCE n=1 Tax=Arachis hypogaea TaxID=3818 RepID=A0A445A1M5_ARAHY|nr:hypothetical protein Ahy_B03g065407 [Arachis hypogaea]